MNNPAGEPWIDAYTFTQGLCLNCTRKLNCQGHSFYPAASYVEKDFRRQHWRIIEGKPHCELFKLA